MIIIKSSKKTVFKNVGLVLIVLIGLVLLFNKPIGNALISYRQGQYSASKMSTKQLKANQSKDTGSYDFDSVSAISTNQILQAQFSEANLSVVGYIAIPDLNMDLPIFNGVGGKAMLYGAGTMKENQTMGKGNYALASHHVFGGSGSEKLLFSPLMNATEGMKIYLTDKETVYTYTITNISIVTPEHVEVINDTEGVTEITLITCTDAAATQRTVVKGQLTKTTTWKKASKAVKSAFK